MAIYGFIEMFSVVFLLTEQEEIANQNSGTE